MSSRVTLCATGVALCLWTALPVSGQYYAFKLYAQAHGLKNVAVNTLAQDRAGYVWVATQAGLYRYDGFRFSSIGSPNELPSLDVTGVVPLPDGSVWVSTRRGLAIARGAKISRVATKNHVEVFGSGHIAADGAGRLYVGARVGLVRVAVDSAGAVLEEHLSPEPASAVYVGADGAVWFGCKQDLCRFDPKLGAVQLGARLGLPLEHGKAC